MDPYGLELIKNRHWFESQKAYHTLIGYAKGQLNSVENCVTGKLGTKRKELVKEFGYDVKYAMHTIRILRMAREFFGTGNLKVYRENDIEELLFIRNGGLKKDEWIDLANQEIQLALWAADKKILPPEPNTEAIKEFCNRTILELNQCKMEND
jgi:hypothetical protein